MADGFGYPEYLLSREGVLSLADGTFSSTEITLPVDPNNKKAAVIHKVEFFYPSLAALHDSLEYITLQLTYNEQTDIINPNNNDLIDQQTIESVWGSDVAFFFFERKRGTDFKPGLLVTKDKIYFSGKQDSGSTLTVYCRVFYTMRTVSSKNAMNQLLSQWGGN